MNALQQAFKLLHNFAKQTPKAQRAALAKVGELLKSSEERARDARLALREIDQLRKQRAHMLVVAGKADEGIAETKSLVAQYETAIAELHDEAAFQLAEAALAAFQQGRDSAGIALARSSLQHAGMSQTISRTVLSAIELMQRQQEAASRKAQSKAQ